MKKLQEDAQNLDKEKPCPNHSMNRFQKLQNILKVIFTYHSLVIWKICNIIFNFYYSIFLYQKFKKNIICNLS